MSILVWTMVGMAIWHFAVLVPDRFTGGIVGAFLAGVAGAVVSGYLLPSPGIPSDNPPGMMEAVWAAPGSVIALVLLYLHGSWHEGKDAQKAAAASDNRTAKRPARATAGKR